LYLRLLLAVGFMTSHFSSSSSKLPSLNLGEFSGAAPSELFSSPYSF
jgi:hypothetical protein